MFVFFPQRLLYSENLGRVNVTFSLHNIQFNPMTRILKRDDIDVSSVRSLELRMHFANVKKEHCAIDAQ